MQESSKTVVLEILRALNPTTVLDAPSGVGWLAKRLETSAVVDGIDLYTNPKSQYRKILAHNLDEGLPTELGLYQCIVSCEGLEHLGNPQLFLRSAYEHLEPGGTLLITSPNTWNPQAKLQYFLRGFFPGFPSLIGKSEPGSHMHIMPWSLPQLYLFLTLAKFQDIQIHYEPLSEAKHFYERVAALPQYWYCKGRLKKSETEEERSFWQALLSKSSLYGRHLIVTARKG